MSVNLDEYSIDRITKRGVAEIIVEEEFISLLKSKRNLRLKMGFDPSSPDIHLGHAVGLRKLRQLQELASRCLFVHPKKLQLKILPGCQ